MKQCSKCKQTLPREEFWNRSDGTAQSTCKKCDRERERTRRQANPERYTEKHRRYYQAHKAEVKERRRRHRILKPEGYVARDAVRVAVQSGELARQPCEVCLNSKAEAHHDDYSKPLQVRWLCRHHHRLVH